MEPIYRTPRPNLSRDSRPGPGEGKDEQSPGDQVESVAGFAVGDPRQPIGRAWMGLRKTFSAELKGTPPTRWTLVG